MPDLLPFEFQQRALLAALLIGFSNGALGTFVVLRRSSLVVSALAHALMPGIALGVLLLGALTPAVGFLGALFGALVIGLGTVYISRVSRLDTQTAISVLYTTAFAGGLVLMERIPHTGELENWLFGNILTLRPNDLWITYAVSALILLTLSLRQRGLILTLFQPDVARSMGVPVRRLNYLLMFLTVLGLVTSLQAVGTVLSAALYITPTAIVLQFARSPRSLMWGSGLVGALTAGLAVPVSAWLNVRTGTMIILLLGLGFFAALLLKSLSGGLHHTRHA